MWISVYDESLLRSIKCIIFQVISFAIEVCRQKLCFIIFSRRNLRLLTPLKHVSYGNICKRMRVSIGTLNLAGLFLHNISIPNTQKDLLITYSNSSYVRKYNMRRTNCNNTLAHQNMKNSFVDNAYISFVTAMDREENTKKHQQRKCISNPMPYVV